MPEIGTYSALGNRAAPSVSTCAQHRLYRADAKGVGLQQASAPGDGKTCTQCPSAYLIDPPLAAEAARPNVFSKLEMAVVTRSWPRASGRGMERTGRFVPASRVNR